MKPIGRREELERIAQTANASRESALLILAEPGGGKSWLLEQAQASATIRSVVVRAMPAERLWPLSGLARVFAFVSEVDVRSLSAPSWRSSASRTPVASVGGGYGLQFDDGGPDAGEVEIHDGGDRFSAARQLLSALRRPIPEPLLLLIDDIDQMDDESQLLLGYMAEGLSGTGVRMVAAGTSVAPSSPLAAFRRVALGPLSSAESRALALAALGSESDPGAARVLADASAGSPATIVRGAHAMSAAQRQGREPLTLPLRPTEDPDRLATLRLLGVEADSLRLLEFVSLAAWANTAALLSVVAVPSTPAGGGAAAIAPAGASAESAGRATDADRLEDLEYAGLVARNGTSVRISDPRVRSWLYWNMAPSVRRDRHHRLGLAHHTLDARMEQWHCSFAESSSESVDGILAAAVYCVNHGERAAAVEFAERALRLASNVADHQAQIIALATTFLMHSDLDLAARYAHRASAQPTDAADAVDVATLRMAIDYARTHIVPTNDVDAVVGLYSGSGMPQIQRLLSLAAACHLERWEIDDARRLLVLAEQERTASSTPLEEGVAALVDALAGTPQADGPADAAMELSPTALSQLPVHSLMLLGATLSYREEYARARHVFALVITQPRINSPLWVELARYHLSVNEIRSGRFHSARLAIEEWMACASPSTARKSSRMYLRAWYLLSTGSTADAEVLFGECMDRTLSERNPAVAASVLATQGAAALAAGEYSEATRLLELADVIGGRFTNPALLRSSIDLIEAYVNTNRLREARALLSSLEASQAVSPSHWLELAIARGRGLTAADDRSLALYQRALEMNHPDDSPFERGRTLTNLAATQARLGFVRESEKSLASAHNAFGNAGASLWAHRVRQGRVPDPDAGSVAGILTEEEQLIVEKVREGYRNKEIAAELYISLRTVELRLTHIYRKVGARSRSHLAALLN